MLAMLVIMALMIGGGIILTGLQSKRNYFALKQLAETLNLSVPEQTPQLGLFYPEAKATGVRGGRTVEIFSFSKGSGKSRRRYWAVAAKVAGSTRGLAFELEQRGFSAEWMENLIGKKAVETGDAELDRTWRLTTNQPEFMCAALLPVVREKLVALARERGGRWPEVRLATDSVCYAERVQNLKPSQMVRLGRGLDLVCDLADVAEVYASQKS